MQLDHTWLVRHSSKGNLHSYVGLALRYTLLYPNVLWLLFIYSAFHGIQGFNPVSELDRPLE